MVTESARDVFQRNLIKYSKIRNLSQVEIANTLSLTPSTVSSWFQGTRYPRIDVMQRLASILDVPMQALISDIQDESQLQAEEIRLVYAYRAASPVGRMKILEYARDISMLYPAEVVKP